MAHGVVEVVDSWNEPSVKFCDTRSNEQVSGKNHEGVCEPCELFLKCDLSREDL